MSIRACGRTQRFSPQTRSPAECFPRSSDLTTLRSRHLVVERMSTSPIFIRAVSIRTIQVDSDMYSLAIEERVTYLEDSVARDDVAGGGSRSATILGPASSHGSSHESAAFVCDGKRLSIGGHLVPSGREHLTVHL
jgi:hypothetical protein